MACDMRNRIRVVTWISMAFLSMLLFPTLAFAQVGQTPGDLLDTFRALRPNWFTAASAAANRLFGLLALIEFAWTAVILVLDKSDLQGVDCRAHPPNDVRRCIHGPAGQWPALDSGHHRQLFNSRSECRRNRWGRTLSW